MASQGQEYGESPRHRHPINLISLPHVVIHKILEQLPLRTLKKLRLVSKTTKTWVEQPRLIERYKIYIDSRNLLKQISYSSTVDWNNFVINYKASSEDLGPDSILLKRFGGHIKHLDLSEVTRIDALFNALSPAVVTVKIGFLLINSTTLEPVNFSFSKKKFVNLRNLQIRSIRMDTSSKGTASGCNENIGIPIDSILKSCPNLGNLTFPIIGVEGDMKERTTMLNPLLEYLKQIQKFQDLGRPNDLKIAFSSDFFQTPRLTAEDLLDLVKASCRTGTRLYCVPSNYLPTLTNPLSKVEMEMYEKCVVSVRASNHFNPNLETVPSLHNIYVPSTSKVHVELELLQLTGVENNYASFGLPCPVNSIHLNGYGCLEGMGSLLDILFQVHRPTLQELSLGVAEPSIVTIGHDGWGNVAAIEITKCFPNLTILNIQVWGHDRDYNIMISGLPLLQQLSFLECMSLTDEGLLGSDVDNPLILNLNHLVHLEMSRTDVTDVFFRNAIRYMNLKVFKWTFQSSANVTFMNGISTLGTISGGFGDKLTTLELSKPDDCRRSDLINFVDRFANLELFKTCHV